MRRVCLVLVLIAAGLVWATAPAGAVERRAGARVATPAIAAGGNHTCALLANGTAECWGANAYGQLGNGTTVHSSTPVVVTGLANAVAITAGGNHSCAVLADGTARCWGANAFGQLGDGTATGPQICNGSVPCSTTPVVVTGLANAVAITGGGNHSCALLADGTARCWGANAFGQLGNGTFTGPQTCSGGAACSTTAVVVRGLVNALSVTAGGDHSCALLVSGTAKCWGANGSGQLGNGSTTNASTPVVVSGLTGAASISAGDSHSCAVLANGTAKCWGLNASGQLGNGTTTPATTPVPVTGI
jgi:alpha-tubulin suppressor-like RCC1 family protein